MFVSELRAQLEATEKLLQRIDTDVDEKERPARRRELRARKAELLERISGYKA